MLHAKTGKIITTHVHGSSTIPDSKVHGANMGPTWVLLAPNGPMLAPWTLLSGMILELEIRQLTECWPIACQALGRPGLQHIHRPGSWRLAHTKPFWDDQLYSFGFVVHCTLHRCPHRQDKQKTFMKRLMPGQDAAILQTTLKMHFLNWKLYMITDF